MRAYRGLANDIPVGMFGHMADGSTPHEIFNFKPTKGRCYGYAPVRNGRINLQKLGAESGVEKLNDVLVVWTATHPEGGRYIIGWYDGAAVYAEHQERPATEETRSVVDDLHYSVEAPAGVCHLLPIDERVFAVPTMKEGYPGISPAFYPEGNAPEEWVRKLREYVATGSMPTAEPSDTDGGRAVDPDHRKKVEMAAIGMVTKHYESLRYAVISREKDNTGWDLEARRGDLLLRLEVKGLSGGIPFVEITPNEYKAMMSRQFRKFYRLCIVTDALCAETVKLRIFGYDNRLESWVSNDFETLVIDERVAARISVAQPSE